MQFLDKIHTVFTATLNYAKVVEVNPVISSSSFNSVGVLIVDPESVPGLPLSLHTPPPPPPARGLSSVTALRVDYGELI